MFGTQFLAAKCNVTNLNAISEICESNDISIL